MAADVGVVGMLRDALERAQRGEIAALALVAVTPDDKPLIGYLERDRIGGMTAGVAALHYHLAVETLSDPALDSEFPSKRLGPF